MKSSKQLYYKGPCTGNLWQYAATANVIVIFFSQASRTPPWARGMVLNLSELSIRYVSIVSPRYQVL